MKVKKIIAIICSTVLALILLSALTLQLIFQVSGTERYFSGQAEEYYSTLIKQGFPADYAISLTELHLLHPNWNFVPLLITEGDETYTWDHVIRQETKDPKTNLIPASATYKSYRHPTNLKLYDSGYHQASVEAVEYFMDPRNFLNETDIFQFFDLAAGDNTSEQAVKAILNGTFMEDAKLENGNSYAEYFCKLGNELGINPVYLAAKIRQEQGVVGTSPVISGQCGTVLSQYYQDHTQVTENGTQVLAPSTGHTAESLRSLNGYYNLFNTSAGGNGLFEIYYNAMSRAIEGTPGMAEQWDGTPSWNTKWKSLYGGAYLLKTNYIDEYQSTVYLQKFNVDSRSDRNFWGQYMQAVSGAMSESRSIYQAFASVDALDAAHTFLIPIYQGMPEQPCKDPANGSCSYLAIATQKYSYETLLTSPSLQKSESEAIYAACSVITRQNLKLNASVTHSYGIERLEYSWDAGNWKTVETNKKLDLSIPVDFSENTQHILVIRGIADYDNDNSARKSNRAFLCAVIYVSVEPPPQINISLIIGNTKTEITETAGEAFSLPSCEFSDFAGWLGSDGSLLPSGAKITSDCDLSFTALFLQLQKLDGAALSLDPENTTLRFSSIMDEEPYRLINDQSNGTIALHAKISTAQASWTSDAFHLSTVAYQNTDWLRMDISTPTITDFNEPYSVDFYVTIFYTNGESTTLTADGAFFSRTAAQVARSALADQWANYSEAEQQLLARIACQS